MFPLAQTSIDAVTISYGLIDQFIEGRFLYPSATLAKYGDFMKAAKTILAAIHALLLGDASTIGGLILGGIKRI